MKTRIFKFFALCALAVSLSGCVVHSSGSYRYSSDGIYDYDGYYYGGTYRRVPPHRVVVAPRPVVVAPTRTVVIHDKRTPMPPPNVRNGRVTPLPNARVPRQALPPRTNGANHHIQPKANTKTPPPRAQNRADASKPNTTLPNASRTLPPRSNVGALRPIGNAGRVMSPSRPNGLPPRR